MAEPQDITVIEKSTVHFNCSYAGTTSAPLWIINNEVFTIDRLPGRHSYSNQVLTVNYTQVSDSGNTYRCSFIEQESRVATLMVLSYADGK